MCQCHEIKTTNVSTNPASCRKQQGQGTVELADRTARQTDTSSPTGPRNRQADQWRVDNSRCNCTKRRRKGKGENIKKYKDLKFKIQRMWNIQNRVMSILIRYLGTTSNNLENHLEKIPGENKDTTSKMRYSAAGTCHKECWISYGPGKTPISEKNTSTNTRVEWGTGANHNKSNKLK